MIRATAAGVFALAMTVPAQSGEFSFVKVEQYQGSLTAFFLSEDASSKKPFYFATSCETMHVLGVQRLTEHYLMRFAGEGAMQPKIKSAVEHAMTLCNVPVS